MTTGCVCFTFDSRGQSQKRLPDTDQHLIQGEISRARSRNENKGVWRRSYKSTVRHLEEVKDNLTKKTRDELDIGRKGTGRFFGMQEQNGVISFLTRFQAELVKPCQDGVVKQVRNAEAWSIRRQTDAFRETSRGCGSRPRGRRLAVVGHV